MRAVAYQTIKEGKQVRVVNTAGLDYTTDNVVDLLTAIAQSRQPYMIAVVWDTATFWKPIFPLLPGSEVSNLKDGKAGRIPGFRLWWGILRHARVIGINNKMGQLISGNIYEAGAGEIEISELKQYFERDDTPTLAETEALGNQVITTLAGMGLRPTSLISAIGIYKEEVLDKLPLPVMLSMPEETWDCHILADNTLDEWSKSYKTEGCVYPIYSYDLTNAYGSALAELPNLNYADFRRSAEIPEPGFYWGVVYGKIHNKTLVSPLVRPDTGRPYVGYWLGAMTVDLYACLIRWGIADMEIRDGWYIYLNRLMKPFDYSMRRLYSFRNGKDELLNRLAKAMSVGTWGKLIEARETKKGTQYTDLFNPVYGSMVVNATKIKVTDFIYSHGLQDDLISVTIDGLKTAIDLDVSTERKFDEWRKVVATFDK